MTVPIAIPPGRLGFGLDRFLHRGFFRNVNEIGVVAVRTITQCQGFYLIPSLEPLST